MQGSTKSIDLLKNRTNLLDEFIKWALSFGRLLIIVVEVVAFTAFIWRFTLDRQLIDLNDKIKQEQAIIEATKSREDTYRNLQQRLASLKLINTNGNKSFKIMNDIVAFTPAEITFNSITIENGQLKIDSNVQNIASLTSFINSLREYKQIDSVNINSIQNRSQSSSVNVIISAKLKEGK